MTSVINRKVIEQAFAEAAEIAKSGSADERAGKVLPVGAVVELRQRIGLSREEFAECYRIPIETLKDSERGTIEPDAVAKAFLAVIAADPDGVAARLEGKPAAAE